MTHLSRPDRRARRAGSRSQTPTKTLATSATLAIALSLFGCGGDDARAPAAPPPTGSIPGPGQTGGGGEDRPAAPKPNLAGPTSFESPVGSGVGAAGGRATDNAAPSAPGAAPAPAADGNNAGATAPARLVEEGDIVKVQGTTLYVLNRYRGVQVIDLSNPDQPRLLSRAPLYGNPVEMYVRGTTVYALVSDYFTYWRCAECDGAAKSFHGSTLAVVDVANPSAATVKARLDVEGVVSTSRIVGDVLYVVSDRYASWYQSGASDDTKDLTFVQSVDISNPAQPKAVARENFPREGWQNHVNVTDKLLYVASSGWGQWQNDKCERPQPETPTTGGSTGNGGATGSAGAAPSAPTPSTEPGRAAPVQQPCSRVTAVDISSPTGAIKVGASAFVPGIIQNRWFLDWHAGVFRLLAAAGWGNQKSPPVLHTFTAATADELAPLGKVAITLPKPESVTAVRFDGPRAYVVTFERIDPLWTVDLSNPAKPFVAGHLETPGWLDHIVPRGDYFVSFGHDRARDTDPWSLHVSLYDVRDLANPKMITRHMFGDGWGYAPDKADNFDKLFKVLDDQKLILFPFQSWSQDKATGRSKSTAGVQLFDLDLPAGVLAKRGFVAHPGAVQRALPYANRILTVSDELLQVMDVADRDKPRLTGSVELARNVTDIAVDGDRAIELVGDYNRGETSLLVVPANDPDSATPLAKLSIPAQNGRLFTNGALAYLVSQTVEQGQSRTRVDVVDVSGTPRARGSLVLPQQTSYWSYGYSSVGGVTQVRGSTLVLSTPRYNRCGDGGVPKAMVAPAPGVTAPDVAAPAPPPPAEPCVDDGADFFVLDLANPDAPALAAKVRVPGAAWVSPAGATGTSVIASHHDEVRGIEKGVETVRAYRHYLTRIDVADPYNPVLAPKVNVPGQLVGVEGDYLYTTENVYDPAKQKTLTTFYALYEAPGTGKAYLQGKLAFEGYASGLQVRGTGAVAVIDGALVTLDLGDPERPAVAARLPIPGLAAGARTGAAWAARSDGVVGSGPYYGGSAYLRDIVGGRAFLSVGAGFLVYDVQRLAAPALEQFVRTQGWVQEVRTNTAETRAYLPSGLYGVGFLEFATN